MEIPSQEYVDFQVINNFNVNQSTYVFILVD